MKNKKIYIVLTHTYNPVSGERQEKAEFVDSLRNRDHNTATTILDFTNEIIIKDRGRKQTYQEIMWHLVRTYPTQMNELIVEYK